MRSLYRPAEGQAYATIILAPPVCGLYGELGVSFQRLQQQLAAYGSQSYAVEFSGQNRTPGQFSVARSCAELCAFSRAVADREQGPIVLFGICSGALASLHAAQQDSRVKAVFCWEASSAYSYRRGPIRALARRFGIRFDPESALMPVQAQDALVNLDIPVVLSCSTSPVATTLADQAHLLSFCRQGRIVLLDSVDHLPSSSAPSITQLADAIAATVTRVSCPTRAGSGLAA